MNVDDITVTAYYEDGYSEQITAYTTNADELDMNTVGEKILAVSYTKTVIQRHVDLKLSLLIHMDSIMQYGTVIA